MRLLVRSLIAAVLIFAATKTAESIPILNNSGSTGEDSVHIDFQNWNVGGTKTLDIVAGDSVYLMIIDPSGTVCFRDSMAANNAKITTNDWEDWAGGNLLVYKNTVAAIDGNGVSEGNYTAHLWVHDIDSACYFHSRRDFQLYTPADLNAILDKINALTFTVANVLDANVTRITGDATSPAGLKEAFDDDNILSTGGFEASVDLASATGEVFVATDGIAAGDMSTGAIVAATFAAGAINAAAIAADAIGASEIATDAIGAAEIAASAIGTSEWAAEADNNGINWADIDAPTTTQGLTGTTISSSQVVASVSGAVGSVTAKVTLVDSSAEGTSKAKALTYTATGAPNVRVTHWGGGGANDTVKAASDSGTYVIPRVDLWAWVGKTPSPLSVDGFVDAVTQEFADVDVVLSGDGLYPMVKLEDGTISASTFNANAITSTVLAGNAAKEVSDSVWKARVKGTQAGDADSTFADAFVNTNGQAYVIIDHDTSGGTLANSQVDDDVDVNTKTVTSGAIDSVDFAADARTGLFSLAPWRQDTSNAAWDGNLAKFGEWNAGAQAATGTAVSYATIADSIKKVVADTTRKVVGDSLSGTKLAVSEIAAFFGACDECYYRLFPEGGSPNKDSAIVIDGSVATSDSMLAKIIYKHGTSSSVYDTAFFYTRPWW